MVYVVQDTPKKNIASATKWGKLALVLEEKDEARILNIPAITHKIKNRLAKMTPDDFLILIGSPVSIGIACAVASDITGGRFNILKWDNQEGLYYPLSVDLNKVES